ncbi:MAG: hypothetical protein ACO1SV_08425 [Fimbriimonas sp.]
MKIVTRSRFLFLAALAVAAVGCGGGGSNPTLDEATGVINYVGATPTPSAPEAAVVVPASNGVVVSTGEGEALIPSGAVPAGTTVDGEDTLAVFEAGFGFPGVFSPTAQVRVNGVAQSGALVGTDGLTDQAIAVPVSEAGITHTLSFPAGTLDTRMLDVGSLNFEGSFYIRNARIISPIPTSLAGNIPNNGENAGGTHLTATFLEGNNGRTVTLRVVYGNGFVLAQTRTISNDKVRFANLTTDTTSVPGNGVESISFIVGDLP